MGEAEAPESSSRKAAVTAATGASVAPEAPAAPPQEAPASKAPEAPATSSAPEATEASSRNAAKAPAPAALSRRSFVAGGVGAVVLVALGGAGSVAGASEPLVRPPGAQDESRFLSLCIRCDRCRSACPQGAIGVGHLEDGLVNMRVPYMSFKRGACDFCGGDPLCVANCPTQAIMEGFDPLRDKMGVAVVDSSECLLYRSNSRACSKQCITACPYDAVSYDETNGTLSVDEQACNGCGACECACPSASYGTYTASGKRGINVKPVEVVA